MKTTSTTNTMKKKKKKKTKVIWYLDKRLRSVTIHWFEVLWAKLNLRLSAPSIKMDSMTSAAGRRYRRSCVSRLLCTTALSSSLTKTNGTKDSTRIYWNFAAGYFLLLLGISLANLIFHSRPPSPVTKLQHCQVKFIQFTELPAE